MKPTTLWWSGCALLVLVLVATYAPSLHNEFVWDDSANLANNPHLEPFDLDLVSWAFTTFRLGHYQPLSWISLAADRAIWGADPWGTHLTSLILHALNALLFAWLARGLLIGAAGGRADGRAWARMGSLLAAAVFALHPMRVESVAWATERRDVLSGAFFLLAMIAYLRWTRTGGRGPYVATLIWFTLSLLSKALALAFPIVLLVLDVYPLRRWRLGDGLGGTWARIREKLPMFALSAAFGLTALFAQAEAQALTTIERYSGWQRLAQIAYSAAFYPRQVFARAWYPLYERPSQLDPLETAFLISAVALVLVTAALWSLRRRMPAGLAAWIIYLALLAPVSGVAQSGSQLTADRYSYLAGMAWAVLLGGGAALAWHRARNRPAAVGCVLLLTALICFWTYQTRLQTRVWANEEVLWTKVLERGPSAMAFNNLGSLSLSRGDSAGALVLFGQSLDTAPTYGRAWSNILATLEKRGAAIDRERFLRVVQALETALPHHQSAASAWFTLGLAYTILQQPVEAEGHLRKAVEIKPEMGKAWRQLGFTLASLGRNDEAEDALLEALRLDPSDGAAAEGLRRLRAVLKELRAPGSVS